jgi:two-component system CheB/CheR fusion protein
MDENARGAGRLRGEQPFSGSSPDPSADQELRLAAERIILARYGPPGVVIDEHLKILQSRGHTSPFFEMPQGPASLDLSRMLRDGLSTPVSQAAQRAIEQDLPVRIGGLQVSDNGELREVMVEVLPVHMVTPRSSCFLVLFAPSSGAPSPPEARDRELAADDKEALLERFRRDLYATKFYLQTLLEERDARAQELMLANEAMRSANQSMRNAQQELEMVGGELHKAREELQKTDEIKRRNADLSSLLNSANLPVLLLGNELQFRHFSQLTQRVMNLRPQDLGRPFTDIRLNLRTGNLESLFQDVLQSLTPCEMEVQDGDGRWYLLRAGPYRTADNRIDGLVVVLVDIDQMRRVRQELRSALDLARLLIESLPLPLAVIDRGFRIRIVNDAFRRVAAIRQGDLDGRSLPDLVSALWGLEEPLRTHLQNLRDSPDRTATFSFEQETSGEKSQVLQIRGGVLESDGHPYLVLTFEEITAHREIERLWMRERARLAAQVHATAQELTRAQKELRAMAASLFASHEEERRSVARELHDDICQKLALLEIDAQQAEPRIASDPSQARRELERLRSAIGELSEGVRRISHGLHPSAIEDLGITPAIRSLTEDFAEREEMIATFQAENIPESIPLDIATGMYRVAQEALRNIARHAGRTHVKVLLAGEAGALRLQVIDAGKGFESRDRHPGLGLMCAEERARIMGGSLTVESTPGEGTRVNVMVPLP